MLSGATREVGVRRAAVRRHHGLTISRGLAAFLTLLFAVLSSGTLPGAARAAGPAPATTYHLDASVNLDRATASVSQRVDFRNVVGVPLDSIVFRVVPNALGLFALSSLTVDGQASAYRLEGSVLEVPLATPLPPGASTRIDLAFDLTIPREPGRLTAAGRSIALGYWFPMVAVHRGAWDLRPFVDVGDATFSEVADFDLTVTTSRQAHVVATGRRIEQEGRRWRFQAQNVRDLAVAISPDYVVRQTTVGGTTLEVAALSEARAAFYLSRGADFLRWAGERLTPYPYPVLVVADADLPPSFGGLEYPGLILLARGIAVPAQPDGGSMDVLLLHEILHQWFYSLVGNDQIADPWLDEAFVTYLAYRYYREVQPEFAPGVYERTIAGGPGGQIDGSVYDFPSDPPYFGVVYRRGARLLDAIHGQLGDDAFSALLREHIETFRDQVASPRAFLDRAVAASPVPLGPTIAEYTSYGAFRTSTSRTWTVDAPTGVWVGPTALFVGADFPVSRVQVWLDQRKLADGAANALTLDLTDVEPGSYVLLVRIWDHDEVTFERARRVEVRR